MSLGSPRELRELKFCKRHLSRQKKIVNTWVLSAKVCFHSIQKVKLNRQRSLKT